MSALEAGFDQASRAGGGNLGIAAADIVCHLCLAAALRLCVEKGEVVGEVRFTGSDLSSHTILTETNITAVG